MIISVIGSKNPSVATASLAEQVYEELAKLSITLVYGGKVSIMGAACKEAKSKELQLAYYLVETNPMRIRG